MKNDVISCFMDNISDIRFISTKDFYERRKSIRDSFRTLDANSKEMYKWYFYFQLCLLKNPLKRKLWEYLCKEHIDLMLESELSKEYRKFCFKCDKIKHRNLT